MQSWSYEDAFTREPIRRFAGAMATNGVFLGAKLVNIFDFRKLNLDRITVYRNGYPVPGTPLQKDNDEKFNLNSLEAWVSGKHGRGVPYSDLANLYLLVFDLLSTQQAFHEYLHPKLINGSIYLSLGFSTQLTNNVEVFFFGEQPSTTHIESSRKVSKKIIVNTKMETKRWWTVPKNYYSFRSVGTPDIGLWEYSLEIHFLSRSATTLSYLWTRKVMMN